jgi:hypothetical protein
VTVSVMSCGWPAHRLRIRRDRLAVERVSTRSSQPRRQRGRAIHCPIGGSADVADRWTVAGDAGRWLLSIRPGQPARPRKRAERAALRWFPERVLAARSALVLARELTREPG